MISKAMPFFFYVGICIYWSSKIPILHQNVDALSANSALFKGYLKAPWNGYSRHFTELWRHVFRDFAWVFLYKRLYNICWSFAMEKNQQNNNNKKSHCQYTGFFKDFWMNMFAKFRIILLAFLTDEGCKHLAILVNIWQL